MEIKFQGQYNKDIVFKAVKLANKPSKTSFFIRIGLVVLIIIIFIAYIISIFTKDSLSSFEIFRSGRHLITIPVLLYFLVQPYISSYRTATNLWNDPILQKPFSGFISSQGITYNLPAEIQGFSWAEFAKKNVTDDLIVLLTTDGILAFFPRHFFKDNNEWRTVTQWVNSKVIEAT